MQIMSCHPLAQILLWLPILPPGKSWETPSHSCDPMGPSYFPASSFPFFSLLILLQLYRPPYFLRRVIKTVSMFAFVLFFMCLAQNNSLDAQNFVKLITSFVLYFYSITTFQGRSFLTSLKNKTKKFPPHHFHPHSFSLILI